MKKRIIWLALIAGLARLVFGLGVMLNAYFYPEGHMMALLDFPTVGVYFLLAENGLKMSLRNAFDLRFLVIGVTVWMIIGGLAALVWSWYDVAKTKAEAERREGGSRD